MAIPAAPGFTVTLFPELGYVRLHVTLDGTATKLDIYRVGPSGVRAYVRGIVDYDVTGQFTFEGADYEIPFGVDVTYFAAASNASGAHAAAEPVFFDVDDDWLVDLDDARNTGPVTIESFDELEYDAPQGVHRILNRRTPIVTSDIRWTPSGTLVIVTLTVDDARRVRDALGSSSPLLLRSTFDRGVGNMYLQPLTVREARISRIATEPARRWTVDVVEIDRPDPSLYVPKAVTWTEVVAEWATWQDVLDARPTWGDLMYDRTGLSDAAIYSIEPAFPTRDV